MMKLLVYFLLGGPLLISCYKQEIKPQQPLNPTPIVTDSTFVDSTLSIAGQTWVITKVLNTDFNDDNRSDTLIFLDNDDYTFNGYPSKYNLNSTPTTYKLTLYDTPWGNISGNLLNYNLVSGTIDGKDFYDIFNTYSDTKIWMHRL
jgi:hypothetical protein